MKGLKGFQKGELNPSKSLERREQLRQMRLGKALPEAQKKKISESMKKALKEPALRKKWSDKQMGVKLSLETRMKISKTKNSKPKTKAQLKRKADTIFAKYVRMRDSVPVGDVRIGNCITCETQLVIGGISAQAGHFMSRRFNSTRFDERNVNLQCARCNMWGGGEQYLHSIAIDKKYGDGIAKELHDLSRQTKKWTITELEEIIENSKQYIKEME